MHWQQVLCLPVTCDMIHLNPGLVCDAILSDPEHAEAPGSADDERLCPPSDSLS